MQLKSKHEQGAVVEIVIQKERELGLIIVSNNDKGIVVPLDIAQFKEIQGYLDKELGGKENV